MALVRYLASDALRSQRWIAPLVLYATIVLIIDADTGSLLGAYAASSVCLFVGALWIASIVLHSEDPTQAQITAVTIGSAARLRTAKLATAACFCIAIALASTIYPLVLHTYSGPTTLGHAAEGFVAMCCTAATGIALASVVSRPVIRRAGWAFLLATTIVLADIVVRGAPPTRQILNLFGGDHPTHLGRSLLGIAAETVVLVAVVIIGSGRVARGRD
jgi:hypothetical protein